MGQTVVFKLVLIGAPLFLLCLFNLFHSVICSTSISTLNRRVSNPFWRCIPLSELSPLCSPQMPLRVQHCCCDVEVQTSVMMTQLCGAVKVGDDTWQAGDRIIRLFVISRHWTHNPWAPEDFLFVIHLWVKQLPRRWEGWHQCYIQYLSATVFFPSDHRKSPTYQE